MTMAPPAPATPHAAGGPAPPPAPTGTPDVPRLPKGHPAASADFSGTVALTALTLASTYGLHRLFATAGWIGPVVITAVAVHTVLWVCRRYEVPFPATVAISTVSIILVISWAVLPETTVYGIPGRRTWHTAGHELVQAWRDFKVVVAPAAVTHGFLLAVLVAVAVIAVLSDWTAFRIRATVEAIVPGFTLFVFVCALGTHTDRAITVAVELAAVLAFIVVHQVGLDRRSTAWFAGRTEGALWSASRIGAVIGLVAVGTALVLGPDLPGYGSSAALPLARRDNQSGARSTISPLVDIRTRLVNNSAQEIFTVDADRAEYWRLTSLDTFDGTEWSSNESYSPVHGGRQLASDPVDPQVPVGTTVVQKVSVRNLGSLWLPAAFKPVSVTDLPGVSFSPRSSSLIPNTEAADGASYIVTSIVITPQLNVARLEAAPPVPQSASEDRYLRLPAMRSDILDLARRIVAGKRTEYDKALALETFFRSPPFVYSTNPQGGDGSDALAHFLFQSHEGYCQQYAGAYAVLARAAGLPTRVAVGFTPGDLGNDHLYHVRDLDAHAWPEVLFPGIGWVPFEPTPGRGIPDAQQFTGVAPAQATGGVTDASTTTVPVTTPASTAPNQARVPRDQTSTSTQTRRHSSLPAPLRGGARWLLLVVLAAGALVGANQLAWRWWRARRRTRAGGAAGQVLVAWAEAADALGWWGVERLPQETLFEFVRRTSLVLTLPRGPETEVQDGLRQLSVLATAAEFGPPDAVAADAETASQASARIRDALRASASVPQRLREIVDPRLLAASMRRGAAVPAPPGLAMDGASDGELTPVGSG